MRAIVQRVSQAQVMNVETGKVVGKIGKGLFVLIGVGEGDKETDAQKLAEKLAKLRIMADNKGKMNLSVIDTASEVLVVSQFTLHADTSKGNRPSFVKAAKPKLAKAIYQHFVAQLRDLEIKVKTGKFGAYMSIQAELDGPVTIILEI